MLSSPFMVLRRTLSTKPVAKCVQEFFETRSQADCFDKTFAPKIKVIEAPEDEGRCLGEVVVDSSIANFHKILHGGAIATLVDGVSTAALFNTPLRKPGVSVNMNLSYIKAVKLNETILIDGKVLKRGNKLAYLTAEIYLKDKDGSYELKKENMVAMGTHTKYVG